MHQSSCLISNCLALNKHLDLAIEGRLVGLSGLSKLRSQTEWGLGKGKNGVKTAEVKGYGDPSFNKIG